MLEGILHPISVFVIQTISTLGYPGIVLTMAIESALIPLPSEIIMPFSGYLVSTGRFNLIYVALSGAVGNLLGSLLAYAFGAWGQELLVRKFIHRFGKFLLISERELDVSERWFRRFGNWIILISRLLPGIRTVISLPAGIAKMDLKPFVALTLIGSFGWSLFLAWVGLKLGENWETLGVYFRRFDLIIIGALVLMFVVYIYRKIQITKCSAKPKISSAEV